jgi:hypothetical protein
MVSSTRLSPLRLLYQKVLAARFRFLFSASTFTAIGGGLPHDGCAAGPLGDQFPSQVLPGHVVVMPRFHALI